MTETALLSLKKLHTYFLAGKNEGRAVEGVSFDIGSSGSVGLVGESGCGKSVTALSIMRLISSPGRIISGEILFERGGKQVDLLSLSEKEMTKVRGGEISMIFQEPFTALNPVFRVEAQVGEAARLHLGLEGKALQALVMKALYDAGIKEAERVAGSYPHELSGGLRQRVMIAMALISGPKLLIADEPTTALDVTVQAQILDLLAEIRVKRKLSVIMISHDLAIIHRICDSVNIMYSGRIVESSGKEALFKSPLHPYTAGLLKSIPSLSRIEKRLPAIPGNVPDLFDPPAGCRFHPRCPKAMDICKKTEPGESVVEGRMVKCWLYK